MNEQVETWITVAGKPDSALQAQCESAVSDFIDKGKYKLSDIEYIKRINLSAAKGDLKLTDTQLEKLRRLCQLAEVELMPAKISSHRPIIGPIIVAAKKLIYPILKVMLKDTIRKQRDFNAAVITYLAESAKFDK